MRNFTEKDKDYLRWYTGDIRERTNEGYLISANTKKTESIYKLGNMFLYNGIENECNRISDNRYLPTIENISDILQMYKSMITIAELSNDTSMILYRIERKKACLDLENNKVNTSFLSCSKEVLQNKFEYKNNSKLIKIKISKAFIIDVYKVLENEYQKWDEKEVIILPLHNIVYDKKQSIFTINYDVNLITRYSNYNKVELLKLITDNQQIENANLIINVLNNNKKISNEAIEQYLNWKFFIQEYIKELMKEKE